MKLPAPALAALESLINRALELDPVTRERLDALQGQRFTLHCTQPAFSLTLVIDSHILLLSDCEETSTTTLTGSWDEFTKIALASDPGAALINGNVRVEGDTSRVLELREILSALDLDWEAPLARLIGDVAAHQIGRGVRQGGRWALGALAAFRRQATEFIREESQWVPHPIQVEDFYRDVEDLSLRTEKLEARLKLLQQRLQPHDPE
ncbi:SCP2 domain-containing protein [Litorivivens sp.]|uniref:ubiquinone biosynthesis accessory factor UbiJ n=1 Tax=Litorivivens sp. TaxID=2020868 RepID=UPI00356597FF